MSSPSFKTTPVKWRGLTLEAAKWTFTSKQLQGIVSRAIRQSAESASIRLLSPEVLDNDLAKETERLEALKADIQMNIKVQVRKRRNLVRSLGLYAEGAAVKQDPSGAARIAEDLHEVTDICDQLNDELYEVTDQLSQIHKLYDVHSASALAVALRKLNTSFLKQTAEVHALREEVNQLQVERDEAWKQAEEIAHDLDALNEVIEMSGTGTPTSARSMSRRSSRVSIARKHSLRALKVPARSSVARSSSRRSVRSSQGSAMASAGMRSTFSSDVPPVPPMPPHGRLSGPLSDDSTRNSFGKRLTFHIPFHCC
ncbi:hypothetical protein BD410DRAFT_727102 [Rickenella mellea]|uniref:Uncharacterized protein n=1 Tax=Rickenella mellea TaxID=50990 RepID=A0A4Y7PX40_9AGAM|nr:hypothetical protein BD410DRAFT_727102 [Rickenella mellea]